VPARARFMGTGDRKSPAVGIRRRHIEVALNGYRLHGRLVISLVMVGSLLLLGGCQGLVGGGSGSGTGSGTVGLGTALLDFGIVVVGSSKTLPDTVTNSTAAAVTISSIQGLNSEFQVTGIKLPLVLGAGQSASFNVQFQPTDAGDPELTAALSGPDAQPLAKLTVSGVGATIGKLLPSPSPVPFGNTKIGSNQIISVALSNSGGTDVTVNQATLSGAGFSMGNLALPFTLHAGAVSTIKITFAPPGSGAFNGSITFATTEDAQNSNVVLGLSGNGVSSGVLTPNPSSVAFGSVAVGSNSTKSETLTNTGGATVTISQITASGTGFSVSGLTLPLTLAVNQSVSFNTIFTPGTSGAANGSLSVVSDASNSPLSIPLSGTGLAAGALTATPSSANFGNVTIGAHQTVPVTVTNAGGASVTVSGATAAGNGFTVTGPSLPITLNGGQSTTFNAIFTPATVGAATGTLTITSNAGNPSLAVPLAGTGVAQGQLGSNPASFSFGSIQTGTSKSLAGTLTNSGGSSLTISAAATTGAGFSLSGLTLPLTLSAGQSTSFTVLFSPTATGAASGNVSITSNGGNPNLNIPLSGAGVSQGALSANPTSLAFGSVQVGSGTNLSETLTNSGGSSLTISAATASGTGFSLSGISLPLTLTAGQSTSFTVRFAPTTSGAASGNINITSNGTNPNLSISLSGSGAALGDLIANPTSLAFGSVQDGGTASLSETLTNSGGSSLTISAASATGAGFSLSGLTLPLTLAAGQSTSFSVKFSPTASGSATGSVTITSNGSNPSLSIPLSGAGVTQGALSANPTSLAFGNVQDGSSTSLSETLTNSGGSSITISAASASGTGFSLTGITLPLTVNAGQSTSFTVKFAPTVSGAATGNVTVASDGSNPSLNIPLSGAGVTQGALSANPASLAFGNVQDGSSTSLSETLTNSGGSSITISAASASGTGFSLSGLTLPLTLTSGQSASFTVKFAPTASGAANGTVTITSNGANPSLSIPLSGTGVTQGTLTANPTSLGFGSIQVGSNASLSETLTNSGGSSLTISAASASGTGFSLSGLALPLTLTAGQSTSFTVQFAPTASGAASGSVSITSNGGSPNLSIPLSGTGVSQGSIAANPSSLAFGNIQVGSSTSLTETLTNSGGSSVTISAASASGTGFSLSGLALPLTLTAGQSTSFTVKFAPTASGAASGSISITSNGGNPNLSVPLSGTGVAAGTLAAAPTSLSFGSVQVSQSTNLSETLTNTGGSSVTISQASVTGAGFSISGLSLPLTLATSQSVTFTATFAPTSAGAVSGNLSVVSNASNSPLGIALSGTGTAAGQLAVSPTSLSFGNVVVGSNSALTGSLTASGAQVTINSASLTNSEFALSGISLPLTLAAGQSAPFTVTFTPQASGATSASLSFSSTASNSPAVQTMTGTGTAPTQHTVALTWGAASGAVGYNVYRGTQSGGPYTMINTSLDGTTSYSDSTVTSGQTYYYVATSVNSNSDESPYSNQVQAVIPTP
jgi:Abnormal spindle-like microcephaly-assoc'd, ASPM-SPD-2-Hydin